jgi:hypothetical protein
MADRADLLAGMADAFMETGCLPWKMPAGCTGFSAAVWPQYPLEPREVHFSASWPDITLVCLRSLAGYEIEILED